MVLVAAIVSFGAGRADAAASRCNLHQAGDLETAQQKLAGDGRMAVEQKFGSYLQLLNSLEQERRILVDACTVADGPAVVGHVDALMALTFSQVATLSVPIFKARCAGSETAVAAGFVAAGWNALGRAQRAQDVVPPDEPLRQKAAAALTDQAKGIGLTLPSVADATDFWRDDIQKKGQTASEACLKQ